MVTLNKPPISITDMIEKLNTNGIFADHTYAANVLKFKNYYKFKPYWKNKSTSKEAPGQLDFKHIGKRYKFDKKLRRLIFSATESVENFLRNDITEYFRKYNRNLYHDILNPEHKSVHSFSDQTLIHKLTKAFRESSNEGVTFYKKIYKCTLANIPIWVLLETLEFGTTIWLVREIRNYDQKNSSSKDLINIVSEKYDLLLSEYLTCLDSCRNMRNECAHGSRLYFNTLNTSKPKYPVRWKNGDSKIKTLTPVNTSGLYRKLLGLKAFYKNRQLSWIEFIVEVEAHFENNKQLVSYGDYYIPEDWKEVLLELN